MSDTSLVLPGGLLLVIIRMFALWLYVPIGLVVWIFTFPWLLRMGASIGAYLGWIDINFVYLLFKTLLRPFVRGDIPRFLGLREMPSVRHRIGILDAY